MKCKACDSRIDEHAPSESGYCKTCYDLKSDNKAGD